MSTLPLIVQPMYFIIDCTVLHNRRLLYPRQFQSRSQLFRYIRVQHMLSRSCHQDATLMSACTGTVYPIWIISVGFISRPMLEVRAQSPIGGGILDMRCYHILGITLMTKPLHSIRNSSLHIPYKHTTSKPISEDPSKPTKPANLGLASIWLDLWIPTNLNLPGLLGLPGLVDI